MFGDFVQLLRHPFATLARIDERRRLAPGLAALALSLALPALLAELAALGPFRPPANLGSLPSLTAQGSDIYARWTYLHRFALPIYGVGISLVLWLLAAGLIHLIARSLGGRGDFRGYLALAGYVALFGLIALPVAILDTMARLQGNAPLQLFMAQLGGLVGLAVLLWQNVLLVFAARHHYGLSTERAVAAVIGPLGAVVVLGLAAIVVAVVLLVLSQRTI